MVNRKKRNSVSKISSNAIIPSNTYEKIKEEKKIVKLLTEISNDISGQNDIISQEIGYYMLLVGSFVNKNFRRKITLENVKNFIIEMFLRYIISFTYHFIMTNQEKLIEIVIENHGHLDKVIDNIHLLK
ncbi:MAG: hypothetical protein ACYSOT_10315 [Planctomycetota bacterium]|jgi:uncharacterized protein YqhQ